MKKIFLTSVVALATTLAASAQFMVVTTYDADQEGTLDQLTARMGVGYIVNDAFTVGLAQGAEVETITAADPVAGTLADTSSESGYNVWVRYNLSMAEGLYVSLEMPTDGATDNMSIGAGFSFQAWKGLYIEPNFAMPLGDDDDGDKDAQLNLGIAYRF